MNNEEMRDGFLNPLPPGKYDSIREKMRREVHDESALMLEAALFDIQTLRGMLDHTREENVVLRREAGIAKRERQELQGREHITEEHRVFAAALTGLCREHKMSIEAAGYEECDLVIGQSPLHGDAYEVRWNGANVVLEVCGGE